MAQIDQLTIYFDGLCPLCSREIDHYRKQKGSEALKFVDITMDDFSAEAERLDPRQVHKVMHTKDSHGQIYTGVGAFVSIWKRLPKYGFAARAAGNPILRPLLNLGYQAFATVRPYLPRKSRGCEASPYCETPKKEDGRV